MPSLRDPSLRDSEPTSPRAPSRERRDNSTLTGRADAGAIILRGFAWNLTGAGWAVLLALVATPLVVHGLGPAQYGVYALMGIALSYFGFAELGLARAVLRHGLPPGTLLNVNVPNRPRAGIKGIRVTRLSRRRFENPIIEKTDPRGRKYYWIAGTRITWTKQADSDYAALRRGFVSVTPLHLDMTNEEALEALQQWDHFRRLGSSQGSRAVRGGTPVRTR